MDVDTVVFAEALEAAIAETKVERLRWLCSDANDLAAPNDRETWRRWILAGRPAQAAPARPIRVDYEPVTPGPCGGCP